MSGYKVILAVLTDPESATSTLDLAFAVAKDHGAAVEALNVRVDPAQAVPLFGEGMSGAMIEEMLAVAERQGAELSKALRARFDEACARHGGAASWREEMGAEEDIVSAAGRLADLIVFPRLVADRDVPSPVTANAALLDTGRPVLLAPPKLPERVGSRVAVLWNGSPQASRAVAFAMPFLAKAERVVVMSADDQGAVQPADLVAYLSRHGVSASTKTFAPGHDVVATLLNEIAAAGCDLAVMGAFTHSRLRQLILGGVTRHMLNAAPLPVLLVR